MKKYKNIMLYVSLALSLYLLADNLLNKTQKTGVIQMDKLVYDFKGMKEATERYTRKVNQWTAQSDSLQTKLEALMDQMRLDSVNKDRASLEKHINTFMVYRKIYTECAQASQEKALAEDREMTLGVVNQVRDYINAYAQEEGYDLILTNTQEQSVGYVKNGADITGQVLDYANKKYEGSR